MAQTPIIVRAATTAQLIERLNVAILPLLMERIVQVEVDVLRNAPPGGQNIFCAFTADSANATVIANPYIAVPFSGPSEAAVVSLYNSYIANNPTRYVSPIFVMYSLSNDTPDEAVVAIAFTNFVYADGAANWGYFAAGGGGNNLYENPNPTTIAVGGVTAGTTFAPGNTIQNTLNQMFYPYQNPSFSSFAITGQGPNVEVGYTIPANVTFTWSTSNSGNVQPNTVVLSDITGLLPIASGLANDGSEPAVLPSGPILRTSVDTYQFRISADNTNMGFFQRNYNINWQWRLFFGSAIPATLSGAAIVALPMSQLATGYAGNYLMGSGGFKYICFAHVAGGQINTVADQLTGFNVPMATVADDPAYSNVDGGGFSYALVSTTNAFGVVTNYRVYRTQNTIGASITLVVT